MWKWVTLGALGYGMLCMLILTAPARTALKLGSTFDEFYHALELGAQGQPPPPLLDFEGAPPAARSLPESPLTVVATDGGNHVLRWEPRPAETGLSLLAIPIEPAPAGTLGVSLGIRAEGIGNLALGVRERDGSAYVMPHPVANRWQPVFIPFERLRLSEQTTDENGRLDPDQLMAVLVTVWERPRERQRDRPRLIEIDNIEFLQEPPPPPPAGVEPPPGLPGPAGPPDAGAQPPPPLPGPRSQNQPRPRPEAPA